MLKKERKPHERKPHEKKTHVKIPADTKVFLNIGKKSEAKDVNNTLSLSSVVEEASDDGSLLIHMPLHQGYYYPLSKDEELTMHVLADSKMYTLSARFQERVLRDNLVFAKLHQVSVIGEEQRRNCYRLPCLLPVTIERTAGNRKAPPAKGQMIDFSDGGMLFASNEEIKPEEELRLTFDIGSIETVNAVALRAEPSEDGKYKYKTAVQFMIAENVQRYRFYKYIMEKQREEQQRRHLWRNPFFP